MRERRIDFAHLDWQSPEPGARHKRYRRGHRMLRLLEFTDQFDPADWCRKGHVGLVLSGQVTIEFGDEQIVYHTGDALFFEPGEADRHKARVAPGETVTLLLFEDH